MSYYLAIDIGGTYIKYGGINRQGQLTSKNQMKTPVNEDNAILTKVKDIVATQITAEGLPLGIGISTAGVVDTSAGEIVYSGPTIVNYQGTNLKDSIESAFDIPVHVNNDVNAALLGEQWKGAARNVADVYCITLGTGIGGAYFHDQLVTGNSFQAGEVGYLLYDKKTNTTYEQRASTSALKTKAEKELGGSVQVIDLFDRARRKDAIANRLIDMWASEIAEGLAQIIIVLDPKLILIGGGVSKQGDFLLEKIKQSIENFLPENFSNTELKCAQLGNDAALYGAVSSYFNV